MNNDTLLNKALYGLKNDGINPDEVDNDGGYIKKDGVRQAGFLAQLEHSFSPDGYFAEGPYYLRYAIFPFLVFSHAIHNNKPELDIFNYNDGILKKATNTLLQLTDSKGHFFPINDSQKGMSYETYELVNAVDLMYLVDETQTYLLDWAAAQGIVTLNEAGFNISHALANHEVKPPEKKSMLFSDGVSGDGGGVAVMRASNLEVLFKFSTQGMGHGHFDRLSYSLYDDSGEVIQDYGAVRWVNIDQKAGGRYLPENKTFGKQSIGHNTVVINESSHYNATVKEAEKSNPSLFFIDLEQDHVKVISATEDHAYPGTTIQRTLVLMDDEDLNGSVLIDITQINSKSNVSMDMPLWYMGHKMKTSIDCMKSSTSLSPLGIDNGYQHIWKEAECMLNGDSYYFNWIGKERFYTFHALSHSGDKIVMGRAGANDPDFNLRPDPVLIQRREDVSETIFVSLIESHGIYSRITEVPLVPYALIDSITLRHDDDSYTIMSFTSDTNEWDLMIAKGNNDKDMKHTINVGDNAYNWQGFYKLTKSKK